MPGTLVGVAAKSAAGRESAVGRAIDHLPRMKTNVGDSERWLSLLGGAGLIGFGLTRRDGLSNILLPLAGAACLARGLTGNCSVYQALGVSTAGPSGSEASVEAGAGAKVEHAVVVNRPPAEVYRFWRTFDLLPRFMTQLKEVGVLDNKRSHWVAEAPFGMTVEWDAEIINDKPNELIAWRSLSNADVDTAGSVHFKAAPGGRGTELRVSLKYDPPAGAVGRGVAWLLGKSPKQQIRDDLARFKQLLEAGEIPTVEGQPHGQRSWGITPLIVGATK